MSSFIENEPIYKVKLSLDIETIHKELEQMIEEGASREEANNYMEYQKLLDGMVIYVIKSLLCDKEEYSLFLWNEEDSEKMKEVFWRVEQDPFIGTYINDREGFGKAWERGEYSLDGNIIFKQNQVQILKKYTGIKELSIDMKVDKSYE